MRMSCVGGYGIFAVFMVAFNVEVVGDFCDFYIAPSPLGGRGIFSGRYYDSGEFVDTNYVILLDVGRAQKWKTWHYVFDSPFPGIHALMMGLGMIYNHGTHTKNVAYSAVGSQPVESMFYADSGSKHHTTHSDIIFQTIKSVRIGEELMSYYGDSSWFTNRGLAPINNEATKPSWISLPDLRKNGYCMSDVRVQESNIPLAGRGLFAAKRFRKGDIVTVSPVLVLPKHEVQVMLDESLLLNYVISAEGSDVALLPFGHMIMANHGGSRANAKLEWLHWPAVQTYNGTTLSPDMAVEDLMNVPFAPLDLKLVATRPIAEQEEVLLDYGETWERAWLQYLDDKVTWTNLHAASDPRAPPLFRAPINIVDKDVFPPHFYVDCVGSLSLCRGEGWRANMVNEYAAALFKNSTEYSENDFTIYNA